MKINMRLYTKCISGSCLNFSLLTIRSGGLDLAQVKRHADPEGAGFRPRLGREGVLRGHRRGHVGLRVGKRGLKGITDGLEVNAAVLGNRREEDCRTSWLPTRRRCGR
jgi:hypothetical protein